MGDRTGETKLIEPLAAAVEDGSAPNRLTADTRAGGLRILVLGVLWRADRRGDASGDVGVVGRNASEGTARVLDWAGNTTESLKGVITVRTIASYRTFTHILLISVTSLRR
jgi:hypothetical protein